MRVQSQRGPKSSGSDGSADGGGDDTQSRAEISALVFSDLN